MGRKHDTKGHNNIMCAIRLFLHTMHTENILCTLKIYNWISIQAPWIATLIPPRCPLNHPSPARSMSLMRQERLPDSNEVSCVNFNCCPCLARANCCCRDVARQSACVAEACPMTASSQRRHAFYNRAVKCNGYSRLLNGQSARRALSHLMERVPPQRDTWMDRKHASCVYDLSK